MDEIQEPDGLQILIQASIDHDPGFADVWAPFAQMGKLIDERIRLGLSQNDVAERMGVRRPAVAKMENDPSGVAFARILAYARALGVEWIMQPSRQEPKPSSIGKGRPVGSRAKKAA